MDFKSPLTILVPVLRVWKDNLRRIYTLRQCSHIDYQNMHCGISFTSVSEFTTIEEYMKVSLGGSVVVDFLFIVTPIVGVCNCSMYCCTLLYVHSSIAIILMGKRELIALLNLSSWCLVMVERLFLAVPQGCLQFVIVVFPDHTHLLFFTGQSVCWTTISPDQHHIGKKQHKKTIISFKFKM